MISLLECITIQGYYRSAVFFRTGNRKMLETHWGSAILNAGLLQPKRKRKRCSRPHVHYVILSSPPPEMWPNTSLHIMSSRAPTVFAVTAVLWNRTWWRALHTCCTLASVIRARLSVCRCKSTHAGTHTHTFITRRQLGSWASPSLSLW